MNEYTEFKTQCKAFTSPAYGAYALASSLKRREQTVTQVVETLCSWMETSTASTNAITSVQRSAALERAHSLDKANTIERYLPLFGVPVIIKENIQKKGYPVECASAILKGYKGQFTATAVERLEGAGAVILGTANMDEFAMGTANEFSVHGAVRNPHNLNKVSGGSSGGSAVACATGCAPIALGSDTGGSVRQPASFCGIYGFKPTYGRVSRYGLVAYGSSLDQISPFARNAKDLSLVMSVLGGHDPRDATSLTTPWPQTPAPLRLEGLRVGVPEDLFQEGVAPDVLQKLATFRKQLEDQGARLEPVQLPSLKYTLSAYYILACAEASSNLGRYDGIRYGHRAQNAEDLMDLYAQSRSEGFGPEVKLRIMLGTFALSAGFYNSYYAKAQQARRLMAQDFAQAFTTLDTILLPTAPTSAFDRGLRNQDPITSYLNDIFTIPANLAGIPALSVPVGMGTAGMPIGMQFFGPHGHDAFLLELANVLETAGLAKSPTIGDH